MESNRIAFSGPIPQAYDEYLGPSLFEPFALDLVQRLGNDKVKNVLEVACGTGIVTRHLQANLEQSVVLMSGETVKRMVSGQIEEALAKELTEWLGDKPLASPLFAWVFQGVK